MWPIDIEKGNVPVFFFTNVVSEPSDGEQVRRTVKFDTVRKSQAFTRKHFVGDGAQPFISENQFAQEDSAFPLISMPSSAAPRQAAFSANVSNVSNLPERGCRSPEEQKRNTI